MFDLNAYTGFEDNSEETVILEGPAVELAVKDADTEIAEAQEEVAEIQADVVELEARLDVLEDTAEVVEEKLEGMEAMLKGTKPFNADLLQATFADVNRMLQRVDSSHMGRVEKNGVIGNEAFGDQSTAEIALHDGFEAIKDTLAKVGNAIKTFFVNLYKSFVAMIVGLFSAIRGVKAKADALKTKLNGFAEDKIKKEIKLSKATSFVKFEGKLSPMTNSLAADAMKKIKAAMGGNQTSAIKSGVKTAGTELVAVGDNKKTVGKTDNTETIESTVGSSTVVCVIPLDGAKDDSAALNAVNVTTKEGTPKEGNVASTMSKSELIKVVESVATQALKAIAAGGNDTEKSLNELRDKAITALGEDDTPEKAKQTAAIKAGHKAGLKLIQAMVKVDARIMNSHLAVVSAHM